MGSRLGELVAYRLSAALADGVYARVASWRAFDRWTLGAQLVKALDSVGANIAESTGRWHAPDKRRPLLIARGSLREAEHWMLRAEQRELLPGGESARLDELAGALNGMIKRPTPE